MLETMDLEKGEIMATHVVGLVAKMALMESMS